VLTLQEAIRHLPWEEKLHPRGSGGKFKKKRESAIKREVAGTVVATVPAFEGFMVGKHNKFGILKKNPYFKPGQPKKIHGMPNRRIEVGYKSLPGTSKLQKLYHELELASKETDRKQFDRLAVRAQKMGVAVNVRSAAMDSNMMWGMDGTFYPNKALRQAHEITGEAEFAILAKKYPGGMLYAGQDFGGGAGVLSHELGHARQFIDRPKRSTLAVRSRMAKGGVAIGGLAVALLTPSTSIFGDLTPAALATYSVPHLMHEYSASKRGVNYLRLSGASKELLKRTKLANRTAFVLHAMPMLTPAAAAASVRLIKKAAVKRKKPKDSKRRR